MSQETRQTPFIEFLPAADSPSVIEHSLDYSGANSDDAVLEVDSASSYYEVDELKFDVIFSASAVQYANFFSVAGLTNGLTVKIFDPTPTLVVDLTDGEAAKTMHALFFRSISPIITTLMDSYEPDRHHALIIWRFKKPIVLRKDFTLKVNLDDDLSGAALLFYIIAKGRKYSTI